MSSADGESLEAALKLATSLDDSTETLHTSLFSDLVFLIAMLKESPFPRLNNQTNVNFNFPLVGRTV